MTWVTARIAHDDPRSPSASASPEFSTIGSTRQIGRQISTVSIRPTTTAQATRIKVPVPVCSPRGDISFGLEGRPFIARGEPRFAAEPRVHGRPQFGGRAQDDDAHRRSTSPQHPEPDFAGQGKAEAYISTIVGHEWSIPEHDAQVTIQYHQQRRLIDLAQSIGEFVRVPVSSFRTEISLRTE